MVIPTLPPTKTLVPAGGVIIFILSFISTQLALYNLIFSMLLSPEFIVGTTEGASMGRGITLRVDDLIVAVIGFSWLARMAINKELGLFLKTPLNGPIAYYLMACVASTLLGGMFGRVDLKTGLLFVLKYFEYVLIYFMVVNYSKDRAQLKTFVWAMLLTCVIVSVVSMAQIPQGERISAPFEGKSGEPNTYGGYLVFMMYTGIHYKTRPFFKGYRWNSYDNMPNVTLPTLPGREIHPFLRYNTQAGNFIRAAKYSTADQPEQAAGIHS